MIEFNLDKQHGVLTIHPMGALQKADFERLTTAVDPYLEQEGHLAGVIIASPKFPGWENFGALVQHLRFVRDHHQRVEKVAMVTDSAMGNVAEHLAAHFVAAKVKHFPAGAIEAAQKWVSEE
jgi:hypothetical protein